MGSIDVTDLLTDPDFVNPVILITRVPFVNSLGENTVKETSLNTVGSVQPASGRVIQRLPEAMRVANMSSFWVKAEIIANDSGKYSSILVFNGKRYQVQTVFDWQNYGPGYSEGLCVQELPA
jgi:hypothetical protein